MLATKLEMRFRRQRHRRENIQCRLLRIADAGHELKEIVHGMFARETTQPLGTIMKNSVPFRQMKKRDVAY